MNTTFVIALEPDVSAYLDIHAQQHHQDPNESLNEILLKQIHQENRRHTSKH